MQLASVSEPDSSRQCRRLAVEVLSLVETRRAYADILLDHRLKAAALSPRDRALLTQLVYGTLRWQGRIDWLLELWLRKSLAATSVRLKNLLRVTFYQILFLDRVPAHAAVDEGVRLAKAWGGKTAGGLVNAVARRLVREREHLPMPDAAADPVRYLAVFGSHPEWLVRSWLERFGREETEALLAANNEEAPLTLRANRLKTDRQALVERLRAEGLDARPAPWSPQGIHIRGGAPIVELPGFSEGLFQVQAEAAQLVGFLLGPQPGERVLDACAAPGSKAVHLAELMGDEGEVVATDVSARGVEKLADNVRRLGVDSVKPLCADVTRPLEGPAAGPYDRILIDAPCSGLGTLRAHPEIKWRRGERDVARLSRLQAKMLTGLSPHVKPGGCLVYATCTLTREENERVVEGFLAGAPGWVLEEAAGHLPSAARALVSGAYLLTLPHRHNTDGFFAARLKRAG